MFPTILLSEKERFNLPLEPEYKLVINNINENKFNSRSYVGSINSLLKESKAKDKESWESFYLMKYKEFHNHKLFEDILNKISENTNVDLNKIFNIIYYLVIDCSWIGHEREMTSSKELSEFLKECDSSYSLKETNKRWDTIYGIDRALYYDEFLIAGIQLKSESYLKLFTENYYDLNNPSKKVKIKPKKTEDDLFTLTTKLQGFERKFNVPSYIVTYQISDEISKVLGFSTYKKERFIEPTSLF